ncbi:MAG: MFS transporter [Leptospiraceae bacterium]|nr:MFS transporter [Leptospiraceae bacterium]
MSSTRKLLYSMGGLTMNITNLVISQWLYKFYVTDRHIPEPSWEFFGWTITAGILFGSFIFLGRITDAITDPLVAYWSDNTRSRFGRRIPYILYGIIPFAVVFALLWAPPVDGPSWANVITSFVLVQAYFVLYTIVVTPYLALLPEITPDQKTRVNVSTLQALFTMFGTILFAALGPLIAAFGYTATGIIVTIIAALFLMPTLFAIREQQRQEAGGEKITLRQWIVMTLHNRPFAYLIGATSLFWYALNMLIIFVPVWNQKVLGLGEDAVALIMGPFIILNIIFFIIFNLIAKKFGKYFAFLLTLLGSAITIPMIGLVGVDSIWGDFSEHVYSIDFMASILPDYNPWVVQTMVMVCLVAMPIAGFLMLPFAILADIVDYDEKQTGKRREAIFFGVQAIFQKSMIGVSALMLGLLDVTPNELTDFQDAMGGLKIAIYTAGAACFVGFLIFLGYPIRDTGGQIRLVPNRFDNFLRDKIFRQSE